MVWGAYETEIQTACVNVSIKSLVSSLIQMSLPCRHSCDVCHPFFASRALTAHNDVNKTVHIKELLSLSLSLLMISVCGIVMLICVCGLARTGC